MAGRFPDGFLWGAATAGHQVEGNNVNSDCWAMEQVKDSIFGEPSHNAADFYHQYAEDIQKLAELGLNSLRFSLEWSRIEPEEGWISRAELQHYRRLAATCHDAGVATKVTFNHWTTPIWFAANGGWTEKATVDKFVHFVDDAAKFLKDEMDWAITLNEPNVPMVATRGSAIARSTGDISLALDQAARGHPGNSVGFRPMMMWSGEQLQRYSVAHIRAREAIKSHSECLVGWSLSCDDYQHVLGGEEYEAILRQRVLGDSLEVSRGDDFVGVQNYARRLVGQVGILPVPDGAPINDLGWELYPDSLVNCVRNAAAETGRPVLVTEHGVARSDDRIRIEHTRAALKSLATLVEDGVDMKEYLHWTLLDEFEWFAGFSVTFGLIDVDKISLDRTPRDSARWLGQIASANEI